jgi:hypothetical protein
LYSATRAFRLSFQQDGNLVLYVIDTASLPADITKGKYLKPIWATGTNNLKDGKVVRAEMQTDGNLVLYDDKGRARWGALYPSAVGHAGCFLRCQDDGNLVIYSPTAVVWHW